MASQQLYGNAAAMSQEFYGRLARISKVPGQRLRDRKRIAMLIDASNNFNRRIILGASQYGRKHCDWEFLYLTTTSRDLHLPKGEVAFPEDWSGDGILYRCTSESLLLRVFESRIPAVNVSWKGMRYESVTSVVADPVRCGEVVSEYMSSKNIPWFGYVGVPDWQGYSSELPDAIRTRLGSRLFEFEFPEKSQYRAQLRNQLEAWIRGLPKPVGVMTWSTDQARIVISLCRTAGIRIPHEVAVVTCEYDELSAALSPIPISGISQDPIRVGFEAARTLHRLMNGEDDVRTLKRIPPIDVIERESSRRVTLEDDFVQRCLEIIEKEVSSGINTTRLARAMGISRRTLEIRFARTSGKTPTHVIDEVRLNHSKQLLCDTPLLLDEIAKRAGFASASAFSRFFKRKLGVPPSHFRDTHGKDVAEI